MTKLQDMYWSTHKWPEEHTRWKLKTFDNAHYYMFIGLPKHLKDDRFKFDRHTNEWAIACLSSFIAYALDFCMIADPDNRDNYYEWRKKYKSSLPTKQSAPLHFPYVFFNIRGNMRYGGVNYAQAVARMQKRANNTRRKIAKYTSVGVPQAAKTWGMYFEDLSKSIKKVTQYSGATRKYKQWKAPFLNGNANPMNKIFANYVVVLIMEAQEYLTRFQAGEFFDDDWKPVMKHADNPIGIRKLPSGNWKTYRVNDV